MSFRILFDIPFNILPVPMIPVRDMIPKAKTELGFNPIGI